MFWRKRTAASAPPLEPAPGSDGLVASGVRADGDLDRALEGAAAVLRALASHAVPAGESPQAFARGIEQWASHLLVLAPAPGREPSPRRDWASLARWVEERRKKESDHVTTTTTALREALVAMVQGFTEAADGQTASERELRAHLARIRATVDHGSHQALRREAGALADAVSAALEEQRRQTDAQAARLRDQLKELTLELDEARRAGELDALTGLPNRRVFDAAIAQATLFARLTGQPTSLVLFDIDHFKRINDGHGHLAGDDVLRVFAERLTRGFPRRGDRVTRYGGEEFAVLLPETEARDATRLAARFLATLRAAPIDAQGASLPVTASAGIARIEPGEGAAEVIARADAALYRAKREGRDRAIESPAPPSSPGSRRHDSGTVALQGPAPAVGSGSRR